MEQVKLHRQACPELVEGDTKDAEEKNSLTAKLAKAAKKSIIRTKPQGREGTAPKSV
jgi:hypothetical protein